jgi:hypothetical protein
MDNVQKVHYCTNESSSQAFRSYEFRYSGHISKHVSGLGTNKNVVMGPNGARNQERQFWRGPAAYCFVCPAKSLNG